MDIRFEREGTKVKASVTVSIPGYEDRSFPFTFDCGAAEYAGLLAEAMRSQLLEEIEEVRKDEYQSGWRDKSAHKGGQKQWFATTLKWRNRR